MKTLLSLCLAAVGLIGFASVNANAAVPTATEIVTMPSVAHINQVVVVETGHRHYYHHRRHYRRRYYYRHHRRYYY